MTTRQLKKPGVDYKHARPTKSGAVMSMSSEDASGNRLSELIEAEFPGKAFKLRADGSKVDACFDDDLTADEQTTLASIVDGFTPDRQRMDV